MTPVAAKRWLNRAVDPALDFEVARVRKVHAVTRAGGCTTVLAAIKTTDDVNTTVRVRRCGRVTHVDVVPARSR